MQTRHRGQEDHPVQVYRSCDSLTAIIYPVQLAGGGGGEVQVPHQGRGAAGTAGQERSETRTVISFIINQIEQVCQKVYIC